MSPGLCQRNVTKGRLRGELAPHSPSCILRKSSCLDLTKEATLNLVWLVNDEGDIKAAVSEDKMSVDVSFFLREKEAGGVMSVDK